MIDPSTNTVVGTIFVGSGPIDIAFNSNNGFLYVANLASNTVSVVTPLTTIFYSGCDGTISNAGQTAECGITNAYGMP